MKLPFDIYLICKEGENPRRPVVLAEVSRVFGEAMPVGLVDGVDASVAGFRERCLPTTPDATERLFPGYLACATAHATALASFLRTPRQVALVIEDDVQFHCDLNRLLQALYELPKNFDWCKLANSTHEGGARFDRKSPGRFVRRAVLPSWGTSAYFVSRKGAGNLLAHLIPQYATFDCVTYYQAVNYEVYNAVRPLTGNCIYQSMIIPEGWVEPE